MDNSLSIVTAEGSAGDFPVLKAFQEYIDAEQAKARKRMLGLSVFFIILLVVVVCTFVLVLTTVVNRNQALSDRLLDYALNERRREMPVPQQTVIQPQLSPTSIQDALKPILDRLEREQASMKAAFEKREKEEKALAEAREKAKQQELEKVRLELMRERAKAKKEADAQAAKERHLRRLYPDYYAEKDEEMLDTPSPRPRSVKRTPPPQSKPAAKPQPAKNTATTPAQPKTEPKKASTLNDLKPVSYFDNGDEDSVPFILETPK